MSATGTSTKRSTARRGDPGNASRGAAVARAKSHLANLLSLKSSFQREKAEFAILAQAAGIDAGDVRARLANATLDELTDWTSKVVEMFEQDELEELK
jgi:multidrug efflux pump subunit AcrB